ncbi:MAG: hypothetical protein M0T70_03920 [Geobacteraceae bacterium]|nr:hypothetical protein [Geobacteraceae bacterium]
MKLESKPAANMLLYVVIIVIGFLLMYLARDFSHAGTNVLCGFLLGGMLSGIGIMAMVAGESRTVELDERRDRIVLDVRRRFGGGRQIIIPFSDIKGFGIGVQGKDSAGSRFYDVVVRLNNGKEIYLFGGCVFEGRMSREWVEGIRGKFESTLGRCQRS